MLHITRLASVACVALSCQTPAQSQTELALIPRATFFAPADKEQVMLSTDGKWVGYLASSGGTMNLWAAPIDKPTQARAVTKQRGTPVIDYRWTNLSGRVLYRIPSDGGTHVLLLNLDTGESRDITTGKGVTAWIEKLSPDHVDEVLLRVKEVGQAPVEYRSLNLRTGIVKTVFKNEHGFDRVLFDDDWRPHVAVLQNPKGGYELWQLNSKIQWVPFAKFRNGAETDASQPIMLDKSGKALYLTDNRGRDKAALQTIDLASGKETVVLADPFADVLPGLLFHPKSGRVQTASAYFGRLRRHFLDPTLLPDFDYLRTVAPGDIGISSPWGGRSLDDRTWLVASMNGGPTRYYAYDRTKRHASFLFSDRTALDGYSLGHRQLEVITTRDGLELPADLYLPRTIANTGPSLSTPNTPQPTPSVFPLPLLIFVHGGPWVAYPWNDWNTNRCLQLLADRGYAVLRVEFRGVNGFGRKLNEAGTREWGRKMQDDLIDAADWAVNRGIAKRDRIGIWGWSYGGYAALQALATSDRFACGMAMYAPTDLVAFVAETDADPRVFLRRTIGDDTTADGRAQLKKTSPFYFADTFARPVLIAQGGTDEIVPQKQADRFVAELQKHKKPVTYLLYPDEPHDFRQPKNWVSLFAEAERFFHEHLGGRYQPVGNDMTGSSVKIVVKQ